MRIFDGVELKPALTPTMQGLISWALLLANTVIEADRNYDERIAREGTGRPTTLHHVMEESGLRIPGLAAAVEQLMGGTEEAKQVASLIVENPDPAVLVQKFVEHFGLKVVADPAAAASRTPPSPPTPPPTVTPPAPPSPAVATVTGSTGSAQVHAEPAARVVATTVGLPAFRADFTREAREAGKTASDKQGPPADPPVSMPAELAAPRPSLIGMIEHQLGALRRRMKAHQTELDLRLERAETELGELRRELDALRAANRIRAVPPPSASPGSRPTNRSVDGDQSAVVPECAAADDPSEVVMPESPAATTNPPTVGSPESPAPAVAPVVGDRSESPDLDAELALPDASESETIRAARLITDFADQAEDHSLSRIVAVERELSATRVLVERERAEGAAIHD